MCSFSCACEHGSFMIQTAFACQAIPWQLLFSGRWEKGHPIIKAQAHPSPPSTHTCVCTCTHAHIYTHSRACACLQHQKFYAFHRFWHIIERTNILCKSSSLHKMLSSYTSVKKTHFHCAAIPAPRWNVCASDIKTSRVLPDLFTF